MGAKRIANARWIISNCMKFIPICSGYWNAFDDSIHFFVKVSILANFNLLVYVKSYHRFRKVCDLCITSKYLRQSTYIDLDCWQSFLPDITKFWSQNTLKSCPKSSKLRYFSWFLKFYWFSCILMTLEMSIGYVWFIWLFHAIWIHFWHLLDVLVRMNR